MALPQDLLNEAACFNCMPYQMPLLQAALLRRIVLALDPAADVTPATLLAEAACFNCQPYQFPLLIIALLNRIADNTTP